MNRNADPGADKSELDDEVGRDPSGRCSRCGQPIRILHGVCSSCLLRTALALQDGPANYRTLAVIGGDDQAITYLAEPRTGRDRYVALKLIGPRSDMDSILERYERWRGALASLRHPAIRRILDAGPADEGCCYVVLEYVLGTSLSSQPARVALSASERLDVLKQTRSALDAAHAIGLLHLNLSAARLRIRMAGGSGLKVLGFETRTIIEGTTGSPQDDWAAVDALEHQLRLAAL